MTCLFFLQHFRLKLVTFLEDDPIVTTQRTKMLYAGTVTSVAIFLRTVLLLR